MSEKKCSIYRVCYADGGKARITHVKARVYENQTTTPQTIHTRGYVLEMLDAGFTVKTRIQIAGDDYEDGASVMATTINDKRYIKTIANEIEEDNLGELPTFQLPGQCNTSR